jgi:hypothetical protein
MIAFSCGVMCTIAVDRFWPRARAQCVGAPPPTTGAVPTASGGPVIEAVRGPAVSPEPVRGAEVTPSAAADATGAEPAPPAEAASAAAPLPKAKTAAPAAPSARAVRGATPARVQPTQGRGMGRKRSGGAAPMSLDTMSPTGMWVDPFAE